MHVAYPSYLSKSHIVVLYISWALIFLLSSGSLTAGRWSTWGYFPTLWSTLLLCPPTFLLSSLLLSTFFRIFSFFFLTLRELLLAIYCLLSYLQCFIHLLLSARTDWRKCCKVENSEWSTHLSWVLVKGVKYQENSPELTKWKPDNKQTSPEAWEPGQLLRYLFL